MAKKRASTKQAQNFDESDEEVMVDDDPRFMAETVFEQMFGFEYNQNVGETQITRSEAVKLEALQEDLNIMDMLNQIFDDNGAEKMTHTQIFAHMVDLFDVEGEDEIDMEEEHQIFYANQNLSYDELRRRGLLKETLQEQAEIEEFGDFLELVENVNKIVHENFGGADRYRIDKSLLILLCNLENKMELVKQQKEVIDLQK